MRTWGYGIFDDDVAIDLKGSFEDYLGDGLSVHDATEKVLEAYKDSIEDEQEGPIVYLALASLQLEHGDLSGDIKDEALDIIESGKGLDGWDVAGDRELSKRKNALYDLRDKLLQ